MGRELIWGGLFARCSNCGWKRIYRPEMTAHRLPDAELSKVISLEFEKHRCEDPPAGNSSRPTSTSGRV